MKIFIALAVAICIPVYSYAMDISIEGNSVVMTGKVTGGECEQLKITIANAQIKQVILNSSNGGVADEGYCVGELIRARGLDTLIQGMCVSSCSRMWLGGVNRRLDGAKSAVGLHANYNVKTGYILGGSTYKLRDWIPRFAPNVDTKLMEQWTSLPYAKNMMYFFNSKALLCQEKGNCEQLMGVDVISAGLGTN